MKPMLDNSTSLRIFLMRHGEPVTYGYRNSRLSYNGVKQIFTTAQFFEKIFDDGQVHTIQIIYSSRKRTKESALDLYIKLTQAFKKNRKVNINKPGARKFLQSADPINQVVKMGSALDEALVDWVRMPNDMLKQNKIQTPDEIVNSTINFLKSAKYQHLSDIIAVTHETTLMAFLKIYFNDVKSRPDYAEVMEIIIDKATGAIRIKYRKKEVKQNDN